MQSPSGLVHAVVTAAVVLLSGTAAPVDVNAETFPVRPVKIIVPSTPGRCRCSTAGLCARGDGMGTVVAF